MTAAKKASATTETHYNWSGPNATYAEYPNFPQYCRLATCVQATISSGITVRIFGDHGIAKTQGGRNAVAPIAEALGFPGTQCVELPAYSVSPDDKISASPVRINDGDQVVMKLKEIISSDLVPGTPFVLLVDDSLQASPLVQNQLMQLAAEWKLGGFDLRQHGCIGVLFADNPSLAETGSTMDDLAQADRFIAFDITDIDTAPAVKLHLANKYSNVDLKPLFAIRESLPRNLRHILSWRTFDQMIEVLLAGLPGHWALPYVDGSYQWLQVVDDAGRTVDRTKEIVSKMAVALGVNYVEAIPNPVVRAIEEAVDRKWSIRIIGPHGAGKTEVVKSIVKERDLALCTYSLPVTDFDMLVCPVPTPDGRLEMLLSENLSSDKEKVVFIDEASRAKDLLAYVRGNELVHEHSLGGVKIPNLRAVIAAENPPEFLGRKYDVSGGNISHADRYELTVVMDYTDIDSYGWLVKHLPEKMAAEKPNLFGHRVDEIRAIAEIVVEWHRSDLDNDGRAWISPRNMDRLIRAHAMSIPLESTKIWLATGERAPVSLTLLEARLSGREMTGLRELTANVESWDTKLAAASAVDTGLAATDTVHSAFTNADTDLLWEHAETVVRLVKWMPPMLKVTYFNMSDPDRQKFWQLALGVAFGNTPMSDLEKAREQRSKK